MFKYRKSVSLRKASGHSEDNKREKLTRAWPTIPTSAAELAAQF
jgi:hypothetical protein